MNEATGMGCLVSVLASPLVTFVLGFLLGRNRLPFTIEFRRKNDKEEFVVDGF